MSAQFFALMKVKGIPVINFSLLWYLISSRFPEPLVNALMHPKGINRMKTSCNAYLSLLMTRKHEHAWHIAGPLETGGEVSSN